MNVQNNQNFQVKKNKSNVGNSIIATVGGSAAVTPLLIASRGVNNFALKVGNSLSPDKVEILHNAAENAIKNTGLSNKGVKINYLVKTLKDIFLPKIVAAMNPIQQIKNGKNAGCCLKDINNPITGEIIYKKGTILMPQKAIPHAAFHEIGHSLNLHFSKLGVFLQKFRNFGFTAASLIALFGAFTSNSREDKNSDKLTPLQKTKNFVRDNAGKLAFAVTIPTLVEEAMATVKGQKLANALLPQDLAKHVSKCNKLAYLTYISTSLMLGLSAYFAVKIKNHLTAKNSDK